MVLNLPVDGVLAAAGKSERMGRWKMLLPLEESTVIDVSLETMRSVCGRVILVAGYRGEELESRFAGRTDVRVVLNRNYEEGMFSSVKRGFREVETDWFFFGLGDMPLIQEETYRALLGAAGFPSGGTEGRFQAVIPTYRGREGHPVLLSRAVARKVNERKDTTLREVIKTFDILHIPVGDPGIVEDLDTTADYEAARLRNLKRRGES